MKSIWLPSLFALAAAGALLLSGCASATRVYTRDHATGASLVFLRNGRQTKVVPSFGRIKLADGICYAFFADDPNGKGHASDNRLYVLRADPSGRIVNEVVVTGEWIHMANSVMHMEILGPHRLFIRTHVNPSLGIGVDVDLSSGRSHCYAGHSFVWNAGKSHVAYLQDPPHFSSPADLPTSICVDDRDVYPIPRWSEVKLAWVAEDALAATYHPSTSERRPGPRMSVTIRGGGSGWGVTSLKALQNSRPGKVKAP